MNIKRPTWTVNPSDEPNGSLDPRLDPHGGAQRPSRARSYSPPGGEARLDRAAVPRATSPLPPRPPRQSAEDAPESFAILVEQARSWSDDVLSRREGLEQELAAWREGLEGLTLSLDDVQRQLERADSHGLTAGASMHLFYLSRALERRHGPMAGTPTFEDMQNRASQIRSALMRTTSFELER